MSEVLQLLSRIAQATSVDCVWKLSIDYFRDLGFARVNYALSRNRIAESFGDPQDALFLSSNTPGYVQLHFYDGGFANSPLYSWVLQNEGVCTWRWVQDAYDAGSLSAAEADKVRTNFAMGIVAGISISFPDASVRTKGALALIADIGLTHDDVDRIWATDGAEIMAVTNMMHLRITQLPVITRRRALTDRQREALEWVADGKTTQDIATIMGVSAAMIEKHLRLTREALDVETTAQAVAKATKLNMIFQNPTSRPSGSIAR